MNIFHGSKGCFCVFPQSRRFLRAASNYSIHLCLVMPSPPTPRTPDRNKAILFYFNILRCASPSVLINLQCPTTQVREPTEAPIGGASLTLLLTFPESLLGSCWEAHADLLSFVFFFASCFFPSPSSVFQSAQTDLQRTER